MAFKVRSAAADDASPRLSALLDVAIPLTFAALGLLELFAGPDSVYQGTAPLAASVIVAIAVPMPLVARRLSPLGVLIAVATLLVAPRLLFGTTVLFLDGLGPLLYALYNSSRHARRPRDLWSLAVPAAAVTIFSIALPRFFSVDELALTGPALLATWGLGQVLRQRQRSRDIMRSSLAEVADRERGRAARMVEDERRRIARELHDVVAHCVTVMVVQSGSARLRRDTDPDASDAALLAVEATGRQALIEMRRMVGLLTDEEAEPLTPAPSLDNVDDLLGGFAQAGMRVELEVSGEPRPLPPGLDVSVYRILQEALTNALAHGTPESARVRIQYEPSAVAVEVVNGAPQRPQVRPGGGNGIPGMRERTRLFGGVFEAERLPSGGYRVSATLPTGAQA